MLVFGGFFLAELGLGIAGVGNLQIKVLNRSQMRFSVGILSLRGAALIYFCLRRSEQEAVQHTAVLHNWKRNVLVNIDGTNRFSGITHPRGMTLGSMASMKDTTGVESLSGGESRCLHYFHPHYNRLCRFKLHLEQRITFMYFLFSRFGFECYSVGACCESSVGEEGGLR